MNLFKREWKSNAKATLFWSLGIFTVILIAFYEMDSLQGMEGGLNGMMDSLPPLFQAFFGAANDYNSSIGLYSIFHLYILIALSLHAVILGSSLFAKEEKEKTFEFLYVKGMKRWKILCLKIQAGISILLLLDIVCLLGILISLYIMEMPFDLREFLPYFTALFLTQFFFFSITFLLTFVLPNNKKAGMIGCYIVMGMFLISTYAKLGGNIDFLNSLSIFHYVDSDFIRKEGLSLLPCLMMIILSLGSLGLSLYQHEHRDLL